MKTFRRRLITVLSLPLPLLVMLVAIIPFWVIYRLASFLSFLLFNVAAYRKKVVTQNLRNSFPEKNIKEITDISRGFYTHMADVTLEAFKIGAASRATMNRRITLSAHTRELIGSFYQNKKSIIIVMGHYGNWEWIPAVNLSFPHYQHSAYKPLKNPVANWLIHRMRSRFGHVLVPSEHIARHFLDSASHGHPMAFAMAADQAPSPATAQWLTFLNQETPFFNGPEKLARKFNYPVVFCSIRKQKRGYYQVHSELITDNPSLLPSGEITASYARALEAEIIREPRHWLWSHRRWKHSRKK